MPKELEIEKVFLEIIRLSKNEITSILKENKALIKSIKKYPKMQEIIRSKTEFRKIFSAFKLT